MKIIDRPLNQVEMSGDMRTGSFQIKTSAKAFQILSGSLYSDRIKAIVRELLCNAKDSHIAARVTRDIELHLPDAYEPWLSIEDFGLGLSEDQIFNLYTTYFDSTKSATNEFVGGLGLGSKSPFSYTENFTVESVYCGIKSFYTAFIDDNGVPAIAKLGSEETTQCNGVKVLVNVKSEDFLKFKDAALNFLKFFDFPVKDNSKLQIVNWENNFNKFTDKIYYHKNNSAGSSVVICGGVAYQIELSQLKQAVPEFYDLSFVFLADIGQVDVAPSREQLTMSKTTRDFFIQKYQEITDRAKLLITDHDKFVEKYPLASSDWIKKNVPGVFKILFKQVEIDSTDREQKLFLQCVKFENAGSNSLYMGEKILKINDVRVFFTELKRTGYASSFKVQKSKINYTFGSNYNGKIHFNFIEVFKRNKVFVVDKKLALKNYFNYGSNRTCFLIEPVEGVFDSKTSSDIINKIKEFLDLYKEGSDSLGLTELKYDIDLASNIKNINIDKKSEPKHYVWSFSSGKWTSIDSKDIKPGPKSYYIKFANGTEDDPKMKSLFEWFSSYTFRNKNLDTVFKDYTFYGIPLSTSINNNELKKLNSQSTLIVDLKQLFSTGVDYSYIDNVFDYLKNKIKHNDPYGQHKLYDLVKDEPWAKSIEKEYNDFFIGKSANEIDEVKRLDKVIQNMTSSVKSFLLKSEPTHLNKITSLSELSVPRTLTDEQLCVIINTIVT